MEAAPGQEEAAAAAPLVDFEADSEDAAWAGEQEANAAAAAAADADAAAAAARPPTTLPPSLAARLGPPATNGAGDHHAGGERMEADDAGEEEGQAGAAAAAAAARGGRGGWGGGGEGGLNHRRRVEPSRSADGWVLFVSGLDGEALEDDVLDHFSGPGGRVKSLTLGLGRETGLASGYTLVEYAEREDAAAAVRELDGRDFLGKALRVDWAFVKPVDQGGGGAEGGRRARAGGGHGGGRRGG
jgi:RNA-binding protein 8A